MTTEVLERPDNQAETNGMITCLIDGGLCHSIRLYIKEKGLTDWTVERYRAEYPNAPLLSKKAIEHAKQQQAKKEQEEKVVAAQKPEDEFVYTFTTSNFHELFDLGDVRAAKSSTGNAIKIKVLENCPYEGLPYIRKVDTDYVFPIDILKEVVLGFQLNMNVYLWGLHGTGKTTLLQQAAARTRRPFMRVQHTGNTEESHIVGQYVVKTDDKGGSYTEFQPGPLAIAMRYGIVYCADEYDFAMPSVIAVYQPVLEGEALVIKDAPPEWRVVQPHPEFRFCATGNTNGVGDETGLYQGTMMQNAASYSRFHITEEVKYMDEKQEALVLRSKANLSAKDAESFVKLANSVRESFRNGGLSMTLSPRELINAAKLSIIFGNDRKRGFKLAFVNRCSRVDQKTMDEMIQRIWG